MPIKKFKRIKKEEIPQAFDLDLVNHTEVLYLPGGIDKALYEALKHRHHTFHGIAWDLGEGNTVRAGDWVQIPMAGQESWWIIYKADQKNAIIVSEGGGYLRISKENFLQSVLRTRRTPPWKT